MAAGPHRELLRVLRRPPRRRPGDAGGGPIDVLTGDYLAELTMLILWKARRKDPARLRRTFLRQMEDVLGTCLERGIKVVANAGGLNPAGLAAEITELAGRLGLTAQSPTSPATTCAPAWRPAGGGQI